MGCGVVPRPVRAAKVGNPAARQGVERPFTRPTGSVPGSLETKAAQGVHAPRKQEGLWKKYLRAARNCGSSHRGRPRKKLDCRTSEELFDGFLDTVFAASGCGNIPRGKSQRLPSHPML